MDTSPPFVSMATVEATAMSDNAEVVAEAPAEIKNDTQEQPIAETEEVRGSSLTFHFETFCESRPSNLQQQLQLVDDSGEGLGEQQIPPNSNIPVKDKDGTEDTPSVEPVKAVVDVTQEEKPDQKDAEPLMEEPEAKEETTDDKGEVLETKDEVVKSDDGKGTISSPETTKRKKDKKKRKGTKSRERSPESSRAVPKLKKKSSRSDGSGGSQG